MLIDIIAINICATICGANNWEAVAAYGITKYEWLKTFLALPNGIPSHDTFIRLFARLKSEELQSSKILGLKPRRSTTALPSNISAFTRYMLKPEPWRKPIAPILPNTRLERTNQLSLLPDKDLGRLMPPDQTIPSNEEPKK